MRKSAKASRLVLLWRSVLGDRSDLLRIRRVRFAPGSVWTPLSDFYFFFFKPRCRWPVAWRLDEEWGGTLLLLPPPPPPDRAGGSCCRGNRGNTAPHRPPPLCRPYGGMRGARVQQTLHGKNIRRVAALISAIKRVPHCELISRLKENKINYFNIYLFIFGWGRGATILSAK